jgi:hypothetical protein
MLMMARTFSMFSTHVFRRSQLLQGVLIAVQLNANAIVVVDVQVTLDEMDAPNLLCI